MSASFQQSGKGQENGSDAVWHRAVWQGAKTKDQLQSGNGGKTKDPEIVHAVM
jgi:hypothetical protein